MPKVSKGVLGRPATIAAPRETILSAASRLFAENGYEGTSLQDVAKAVGISKAAVYHYFPSKQVIYEAITTDLLQKLYEHVKAAIQPDVSFGDQLQQLMVSHAEFFEANFTEFVTLLHGYGGLSRKIGLTERSVRDQYEAMLRDLLAEGEKKGEFASLDPATTARAILSMLNWMSRWYRPEGKVRARDFAEEYFSLIFNGLRARQE